MAKTEKCPECGQMMDPRGLKPHRAARHGVLPNGSAAAASKPVPAPVVVGTMASARGPEKGAADSSPPESPAAAAASAPEESFFDKLGKW